MVAKPKAWVVFDVETTGFPPVAEIVEVGAVVIRPDWSVSAPIQFLVRQPEALLDLPSARKALEFNGISRDKILAEGLDPAEAAPRLKRWLGRYVERYGALGAPAYNCRFDWAFLSKPPWSLFDGDPPIAQGPDLMAVAGRLLRVSHRVSLKRASNHCVAAGHAAACFRGAAHRAGEDARVAAEVAVWAKKSGAWPEENLCPAIDVSDQTTK